MKVHEATETVTANRAFSGCKPPNNNDAASVSTMPTAPVRSTERSTM